jgi:hypothetical protein
MLTPALSRHCQPEQVHALTWSVPRLLRARDASLEQGLSLRRLAAHPRQETKKEYRKGFLSAVAQVAPRVSCSLGRGYGRVSIALRHRQHRGSKPTPGLARRLRCLACDAHDLYEPGTSFLEMTAEEPEAPKRDCESLRRLDIAARK